jgi:hypothetical protein
MEMNEMYDRLDLRDVPPKWIYILRRVKAVRPEAIIGGGALRDLDNKRPIKDIDIFVTSDEAVRKALRPTHPYLRRYINCEYLGIGNGEVQKTMDFISPYGFPPVNVTVVSGEGSPIYLLSQIAFDGAHILASPHYYKDKRDKTFTLLREDDEKEAVHSLRHFARISRKYPGWRLKM